MAPLSTSLTLSDLESLLKQEDWRAADQATLALLLEPTQRQQAGWLDEFALAQIPCLLLHDINHLWAEASGQRFGFVAQQRVYQNQGASAHRFARQVGWLMSGLPPLAFFKFYNLLNFDLQAPVGHLPALWYWRTDWQASWLGGGLGGGRGGGFACAPTLDAMMLRLQRCSVL